MRLPRFTTRRLMAIVAVAALTMAGYAMALRNLGPQPGFHKAPYYYLDRSFKLQVIRGGGTVFVREQSRTQCE